MLLNAYIVRDFLAQSYPITMNGQAGKELALQRPLLLDSSATVLHSGRLYVALASQLPRYPQLEKGVVVIVVGPSSLLRWYEERCCVMRVDAEGAFFQVMNSCQELFSQMDAWEAGLAAALGEPDPLQRMAELSRPVFGNRVAAIDESFRFLARTDPDDDREGLTLGTMSDYADLRTLASFVDEPTTVELAGTQVLSSNFFEAGEFRGCVFVQYADRGPREGDAALMGVLSSYMRRALLDLRTREGLSVARVATIFSTLVKQEPLDPVSRSLAETMQGAPYVCVCAKQRAGSAPLPEQYLLSRSKAALAANVAFMHHGELVVCFSRLDDLGLAADAGEDVVAGALVCRVRELAAGERLDYGASDVFFDPLQARYAYLQAKSAIYIGEAFEPDEGLHRFQDIALTEMVRHAFGELPVELYLTPGMRRLAAHDRKSHASYLQTLKVYFDCGMVATAAARALGLHRSTFTERLDRIRAILGDELDDPDARLRAMLCLKARTLTEQMETSQVS